MSDIYFFLGSEELQPERLVELAVVAEGAGFDGVMVSEHFHPWVDDEGTGGFAFSTLGAIAQATTRLKMMTAVTTPLWRFHPGVVAQASATLDRLSGGRFALGVGTGENINEGPLGYEFPGYAERSARMREALEIMRRLLAGEGLTFSGKYYRTDRAKLYSPPLGNVPIYLAAGGPKSATMAGELADGVITSVKDIADAKERVIGPAGKGAVIATRRAVLAKDDAEAWEALRALRGLRAPGRLEAIDPATLRERADTMERADVLSKYTVIEDAQSIAELFRPLVEDIKADIIGMQVQVPSRDPGEVIKMLGQKVLPKLRA